MHSPHQPFLRLFSVNCGGVESTEAANDACNQQNPQHDPSHSFNYLRPIDTQQQLHLLPQDVLDCRSPPTPLSLYSPELIQSPTPPGLNRMDSLSASHHLSFPHSMQSSLSKCTIHSRAQRIHFLHQHPAVDNAALRVAPCASVSITSTKGRDERSHRRSA